MEKKKIAQAMSEKLEYICLDLEQIPETLKYVENINFKPNIGIEENKYRQYRFVSPKELEILLSPCNRLEDTKTKYSKAKPLVSYLEPKTEEEKELYTKQLGDVLKYVDQMNEVDTSNVKPMTQVIDFCNVMREDKVVQEISKEDLMANAPEEENGFFKVPKIN